MGRLRRCRWRQPVALLVGCAALAHPAAVVVGHRLALQLAELTRKPTLDTNEMAVQVVSAALIPSAVVSQVLYPRALTDMCCAVRTAVCALLLKCRKALPPFAICDK